MIEEIVIYFVMKDFKHLEPLSLVELQNVVGGDSWMGLDKDGGYNTLEVEGSTRSIHEVGGGSYWYGDSAVMSYD